MTAISKQCEKFHEVAKLATWDQLNTAKYKVTSSKYLKEYQDKIQEILSETHNSALSREGRMSLLEGRLLTLIDLGKDNPIVTVLTTSGLIFNIYKFVLWKDRKFPLMNRCIFASCREGMAIKLNEIFNWEKQTYLNLHDLGKYLTDCSLEDVLRCHSLLEVLSLNVQDEDIVNDASLNSILNKMSPYLNKYCPKLFNICLDNWGQSITDKGWTHLAKKLPQLSALELDNTAPPNPGVAKAFKKLDHLRILAVKNGGQLGAFCQACPTLSSLSLSCSEVSREIFSDVAKGFENLERLKLSSFEWDAEFLSLITTYGKNLTDLTLESYVCYSNGRVLSTDQSLDALTLGNLTHLSLSRKCFVSVNGLQAFLARHPKMTFLDLTGCDRISNEDIKALQTEYPKLDIKPPRQLS